MRTSKNDEDPCKETKVEAPPNDQKEEQRASFGLWMVAQLSQRCSTKAMKGNFENAAEGKVKISEVNRMISN